MPAFAFGEPFRGSSSGSSQRKMSLLNTKTFYRDHSHLSHRLLRSLNRRVLTKCEPDLIAKENEHENQKSQSCCCSFCQPTHRGSWQPQRSRCRFIPFLVESSKVPTTICKHYVRMIARLKTTHVVLLSSTAFGDWRALHKD
jgi:hypothetical protein